MNEATTTLTRAAFYTTLLQAPHQLLAAFSKVKKVIPFQDL